MTFAHGSRILVISLVMVLITLFIFGGIKLSEKKYEVMKNKKEYEVVTLKLNEKNHQIVEEVTQ